MLLSLFTTIGLSIVAFTSRVYLVLSFLSETLVSLHLILFYFFTNGMLTECKLKTQVTRDNVTQILVLDKFESVMLRILVPDSNQSRIEEKQAKTRNSTVS